ncbi:MAG: ubiquinone biosynthesis protein UbiD [Acidobacteria bacterium RIFCSPLOWO2_02_FULL_67_21]|nr:MAG: ubiquinone biosynthesis protein UbiD [Acidobacteria bacterium RIFCSPLOWO2_02_FULL_67_21]
MTRRPTDLREWIARVKQLGELQHVSGAHWDLEIGTISEINYRRKPPAALLFDDIAGYPRGHRVLTGSMSNARRMAVTLGLDPDLDTTRLVQALRGKPLQWEAAAPQFEPEVVTSGPILENIVSGGDVDLSRFPAPRWHEHDGGRYIGTGVAVVTSDPDTGRINLGAYRMMLQEDGRTASINAEAGKQGRAQYDRWFALHGRAPVLASFGHDPLLLMVAGTEVPNTIGEYAYAGAMAGEKVKVIRGQVTGLPMPAAAEIVVEGWIRPDRVLREGPFGEWTGYYSGSLRPVPAMDIERLYFRNDPIILGAPPGKPPNDYSYMRALLKSAMIQDELVKVGVRDVRGVWAHETGGGRLLIVVSITQRFCGHSRQAGFIAAQCQAAAYMNRFVIVVDDDVDPMNLEEVMWAVSTRCEPSEDIEIMRKSWGSKVDPMLADPSVPYNTRALIDACRPFEKLETFPRVAQASPARVRETVARWKELFADPRFPLPETAVPSPAVDERPHGTGLTAPDRKD